MAGNLERHEPSKSSLSRRGGAGVSAGRATDLAEFSFTKQALIYADDMPKAFRRGVRASTEIELHNSKSSRSGGELILASDAPAVTAPRTERETRKIERSVIASGMRQLDKPRRASGRVVQRRVGWQATPELIVITTAERELAKSAEGPYRPSGDWMIEDRRTFRNADGKATKRTGKVAVDSAQGATRADSSPAPGTEATVAEQFPLGASALGLLPASVRSSAIARIPMPSQFDGVILQVPDANSEPIRVEVNVLRMDTERAVVIQANQKPGTDEWEVSQAIYRLQVPEIEQA